MQTAKTTVAIENADLYSRPGFLLRRAHQVAVAIFAEEAGRLSLTPPQHNVLTVVNSKPGCSQAELSRAIGYDRATVGAVVVGLEARNLILRHPSAQDRRLKILTITSKGKKLLAEAALVTDLINERVVEALSPRERAVFVDLLRKIALSRSIEA